MSELELDGIDQKSYLSIRVNVYILVKVLRDVPITFINTVYDDNKT